MTTQTQKALKSICFAYFADGKFIGWYADTFGSIRECPKVYPDTIEQIDIITKNFRYKLSQISNTSELSKIPTCEMLEPLDAKINKDSADLSQYKEVELRIVECPEYEGVNPNFNMSKYNEERLLHKQLMANEGIFNIPSPSKERTEAVQTFIEKYPRPKGDSWIHADYHKVAKWAEKEPTEFIATIGA